MKFPDFINVPTAIEGHSKLNLSSQHITTSDWLLFSVAKYVKMVPGQSIDIQHLCFQRLAPMPVPTFGRGQHIHRAYFVPFRTVWTAWDAFYNNTPHAFDASIYTTPTNARFVYDYEIVNMFLRNEMSNRLAADAENYDFEYSQLDDDLTPELSNKYNFTPLGRFAYKLLRSLGISVTFVQITGVDAKPIDCMKLLCVGKVYLDFFYPKQYANTSDSIWLESLFNSNSSSTWEQATLSGPDLSRFMQMLYRVPYGSDYFTSAWDNPVSPNYGTAQGFEIPDIANNVSSSEGYRSHVTFNPGGSISSQEPVLMGGSTGTAALNMLTKYSLTALNRATDYIKRFQLVGSRILDRFFARFGIKLSSEALKRSYRIAEYRDDIDFADVTSMASTEGANLGSYAGKGISLGRHNFSFTAKEHGILLIVSINVPEISYYQGMHRDSYHFTRLDYWNPEFDALGVQAISKSELYQPIDGKEIGTLLNDSNYRESVFGFTPRYAEYKIPYSVISGDYLLRSKNVGNDSWNLARDVIPFVKANQDDGEHSLSFVMSDDKAQYNRIFYNTDDSADHFNVIHDFNIMSVFPGKKLFEEYEFENEDKAEKVPVQLNGSVDAN